MSAAEMPAEHAILGLLALEDGDGEGYGYDLARHFAPGKPLADVLRLEPGMLYHHLKRLEGRGWVEATREPIPNRPPRQSYTVTSAGADALDRWLAEPVARTREVRLEFLVKLYLAHLRGRELADRLIAEQREILAGLATSLRDRGRTLAPGTFPAKVNALRLAQTDAALAWVDSLEALEPSPVSAGPG